MIILILSTHYHAAKTAVYSYADTNCALFTIPPGDSCTFRVLPVSSSTQHVQIYCTQGTQQGKYMVVKPNLDVIAGSTSDGDTVFHRENVPGELFQTMYLSYPANAPDHYLAFEADSREAQLEETLTSRCYMEILGGFSRRSDKGTDVLEIDDILTIDPPATLEAEGGRKAEA